MNLKNNQEGTVFKGNVRIENSRAGKRKIKKKKSKIIILFLVSRHSSRSSKNQKAPNHKRSLTEKLPHATKEESKELDSVCSVQKPQILKSQVQNENLENEAISSLIKTFDSSQISPVEKGKQTPPVDI